MNVWQKSDKYFINFLDTSSQILNCYKSVITYLSRQILGAKIAVNILLDDIKMS